MSSLRVCVIHNRGCILAPQLGRGEGCGGGGAEDVEEQVPGQLAVLGGLALVEVQDPKGEGATGLLQQAPGA